MAKRRVGIKLKFTQEDKEDGLLMWWLGEAFRYAGIVEVDEARTEITLWCPYGYDPQVWLQQNEGRLRSFGRDVEVIERRY